MHQACTCLCCLIEGRQCFPCLHSLQVVRTVLQNKVKETAGAATVTWLCSCMIRTIKYISGCCQNILLLFHKSRHMKAKFLFYSQSRYCVLREGYSMKWKEKNWKFDLNFLLVINLTDAYVTWGWEIHPPNQGRRQKCFRGGVHLLDLKVGPGRQMVILRYVCMSWRNKISTGPVCHPLASLLI